MARFKITREAHLLLIREGQVLLLWRHKTGYEDGNYSVVAGHIEQGETARLAMVREAREEAGIEIESEDLKLAHVIHRKAQDERVSFFFTTERWRGEPENREPEKCSQLGWFSMRSLPSNLIPYIRHAIERSSLGELYSEFGWVQ